MCRHQQLGAQKTHLTVRRENLMCQALGSRSFRTLEPNKVQMIPYLLSPSNGDDC